MTSTPSRVRHRCGMVLLMAVALAGCSPLRMFDTLMPKDAGSARLARDIAYGVDPRQRLDLYAPTRAGGRALPVIVFFYGGSWNSGTKAGYAFVGRALASRGFLVVIPDYRLVPQVRYPAFLEDSARAVRWVRTHVAGYGGDPDRLVLAGHSAGAYNAAMLALDPRWLGADRHAVKGLVGLAGPYDFLPFSGAVVEAAFGGTPDPRATQPIQYAGADSPPALLATGARDTLVLPRNSDALAATLRAHGVAVDREVYPGVGHVGLITAMAQPLRGRAPVLDDLIRFARRVTADDGAGPLP